MNITFHSWLKRRRQAHGFTQDEFAERVGCATQTIRKIESGQRRPSFHMAERIAQVLRLNPEEHTLWMRAARNLEQPDSAELAHEVARQPVQRPVLPTLPTYLMPFVGREHELSDIARLLATPGCRLVTVLGPGGIGKTRLVVEVARTIAGFPDGIFFIPLAPVSSALAIGSTISDVLGLASSGAADPFAHLLNHLRDKRLLLILDNLEHLLDQHGVTLGLLSQLLTQAQGVTLLVTTRERLQLQAEWVLEIAGLPAPPAEHAPQPADYPAFHLFIEHAQRADHRFSLTAVNDQAATTICRLVGGMPLAIELAAAWLDTLPCPEIARNLQRSLELLSTSSPDRTERHRSITAVFDQTWERLDQGARLTLARLSVFPGSFDREAAAFVARATVAQLATLVRHSVLRRVDDLYTIHPLVRQYAAERLRETGEWQRVGERYISYYLAIAAEAAVTFSGPEQVRWFNLLVQETDNIRRAILLAFDLKNLLAVAQFCKALRQFWRMCGRGREGLMFTERALAHPALPADARPVLHITLCHMARSTSQWELAAQSADAALAATKASADRGLYADALFARGCVHNDLGEAALAAPLLEEALTIYESLEEQTKDGGFGVLLTLFQLSNATYDLGRTAEAAVRFREVARRAEALGVVRERILALASLGLMAAMADDIEGIELCREVIPEFLRMGYFDPVAYCLEALGAQAGLKGNYQYGSRLIGATKALRVLIDEQLSPSNRALHEHCVARARGPLSEAEFADAMAQGAAQARRTPDGQIDTAALLELVAGPA